MIRRFLTKLKTFKVTTWGGYINHPESTPDELAPLADSHVVSSELKDWDTSQGAKRHIVVLDIDYPAALVESTTAGHFHLFLDVPGGIPHGVYMDLLFQLAKAGVIEQGYADASERRGHSDVRLPWVEKPIMPQIPGPQVATPPMAWELPPL